MTAYVGVVDHPYFAVSGGDGVFTIENVPVGYRTIEIWHERYGQQTKTIDVGSGEITNVEFTYTGTERTGMP
jgi:hypothetical protein